MEHESRSHGHRRHASSVTLSRKHTSELHGFAPKQPCYDDIFSDPLRFGAPPRFLSRVEDYHEIFNSSRASRGSSIPVLDLPAVRESEAPVRPRSSHLDYSKIFQGFADSNFASTYDQLLPDSNPKELDTSSDDAWTLGETESLSEDSDSNSFEACHEAFGAKKQFNMSYHRTNQRSRDGINGTTHIAQLHVVPGFTRVVDQKNPSEMTNGSKLVPPKISVATPNMNMSGELLDKKVGKKDEEAAQQRANKSNAAPPNISSNINFSGGIVNRKHCKKNEEIAQQRTKESKSTPPMISANVNSSGEIVSRKVGKKDGETAQQRTEESKAAPPKISVATSNPNSSGEIANRKVGKKDEETAQQRTNESKAAPPKITPDMNTSGEIVNRKVCKKDEESAQQRTNENKAAPTKRSPDMNTSGELVNRTVGKKGEETAQQSTNERKATPPKIISDTNASGEIINRKVGKKDEESAQQRTNESKAAPPKISPGTNTSGEIVNRKAGKNEEETSQQRTNEREAEPKISPDLNTGGKIVNREVGKNAEETAQQRTNETEAAPKISPDLNAGGDIVNRKVGKKVEETPQQRTDESKTVHPKISVATTNISISGEMVNKKDVNIAASHIQNYRSNRSASEGDLKFQSVTCGSGPYQNNTLFNAQDASPKNSKADFNKSNGTKTEGSGTDASKDASWSPTLSDEELDVGSDAVASLVAVRRAIADAQAKIRIAKEAMKRKEEGFGSSFKCMSKDNLKSKQKREVEISHDLRVVNEENPCGKCERVDIATDRSIGSERENRRKMDSVSPSFDDEEFFDAKEAPEEINDKVSKSFPEDHCWDGAGGEEAVKQFHKLANSSRQKTVTLDPQQGGTKNKMESIEDYGQKENETTEKIFEQPVETTRNMKAPMEAQEQGETKRPTATKKWEEQAPSSNPFCGIRENMQVEQNVRIFSNKEEHEENQKVIHRQGNVDKLKISHERLNVNEFEAQAWEENEIESREWVTIVKNLEIAHEEEIKMGSEVCSEFEKHENEDKKKLEACEWREECEERQEIAHSKECWEANYSYEREDTGRNSDEFLRQDFDERRLSDASLGEGSDETPKEDYVSEKSLKLKEPAKDEDNGKIPEGIYVFGEKDERLNEKAPEWVDMYEKRKGTCQIEENKIVSSSDIDEHGNEINADQEDFEHEETLKANNASHRDEIMNQCQNQELCYERDGEQGEEAQDEVGRIVDIIKDSGELEISEEVEVNFPNGMNEKEMFERISEVPLSDGIDIGDINVNFDCKQIFWNNCVHSPSACDLKQRVEALGHEVEDVVEDAKEAEVALNNGMEDLMQHVEALVHEAEDNVEGGKEAEVPLHHIVEDRRQHVEELIHEVKDDLGDFVEAEVPLHHIVEDRRQYVEELIHEVKDDLGDFEEAEVALDHKVDDLKQHVDTSVHELEDDKEAEDAFNHEVKDHEVEDLKQHVEAVVPEAEDDVEVVKEAEVPLHHKVEDLRQHVEAVVHEAENDLENAKEAEVALNHKGDTNYFKEVDAEGIENGKNTDPTHMFVSENESIENAEAIKSYQNTESGEMDLDETTVTIEMETQPIRQKEVELNKPHLMAKDEEKVKEREKEREKDRIAVERAIREARERAFVEARERAAVERATSEARERVKAKAQERIEKASAEAKFVSEKAATEAKLRAERAAVERATAEARERALKKALSEKASFNAREHAERFSGVTRENGIKQRSSSLDPRSQSSGPSSSSKYSNSLNHGIPHTTERFDGARGESAQRCQAKLERHQRTVERAAKALAEKNMRDLIAQKEQAERNRLAESLDAEVKRWSAGKHGKLRALLSTLQYILGSDSGWQPVTLNEILNPDAAKKAYRKAALYVHPDKLQQRGATIQQKYICEKVFDLLQDAWNKFNSEER